VKIPERVKHLKYENNGNVLIVMGVNLAKKIRPCTKNGNTKLKGPILEHIDLADWAYSTDLFTDVSRPLHQLLTALFCLFLVRAIAC